MVPHRCPVCDGSGRIVDLSLTSGGGPCHACSGTGIVWEPDGYQTCRCPLCQPKIQPSDMPWHTTTWSPDTT